MNIQEITTRTDVEIAGLKIRGYKNKEEWFLSIRSLAELLDLDPKTPWRFISSNWLKSRLGYTPILQKLTTEDNKVITGVPINIVMLFIRRQDKLGNLHAEYLIDSLIAKSLESRFEETFAEPIYDVRELKSEDKPLYSLYIFSEVSSAAVKIGISSDVNRRHQELETQSGRYLEIEYVSKKMDYKKAKQIESDLHIQFEDCRLNGEWFSVDPHYVLERL